MPPFEGCLRPIEAWTELRTTDRRTYWQGLAWAGGGFVGKGGHRCGPLPGKGPVLRAAQEARQRHKGKASMFPTYIHSM